MTHPSEINALSDDEILQRYEYKFEGKSALFIPHTAGEEAGLIISMSTHNFGERYFFLRGLLKEQKANLLFVKDPLNTYYLEADQGNSYNRLFSKYLSKFSPHSICFFGSSMSGYGALLHGLRLGANIIASNPQIDLEISKKHAWPDLLKTLSKQINPIKLQTFEPYTSSHSAIYLAYGDNALDLENVQLLLDRPRKHGRLFLHKMQDPDHGFYFKNQTTVYNTHNLLTLARKIDLKP